MTSGAPYNVLDFGADPTGNSDSTAAFQAAVNTAGVVEVPQGTYLIAGSVVMPIGAKIYGYSTNATDIATGGLVNLIGGSIINLTGTTNPAFVYRSGNSFVGLTFFYPNQLKTQATPTVYPPTFGPSNVNLSEVLVNNEWRECQFVNSYRMIDALRGHLDFEFMDIVGAPLYRGIETDGCGGTDIFRNIRLSYYYFCEFGSNAATYMQNNAQGITIGRSDAFHMDRIYCGSMNTGLRFFKGVINTLSGPYGSITGLSLDGNTYGIYSESTHPIGVNIVDFMSNNITYDVEIAPNGADASRIQITGFETWNAKTTSMRVARADSTLKISDGIIYSATSAGISVTSATNNIMVSNVSFKDTSAPPIVNVANQNSFQFIGNLYGVAPVFTYPIATNTVIRNNAGFETVTIASASTIDVGAYDNVVYLTGNTNVDNINGGYSGKVIHFISQGGMTFTAAGNISNAVTVAASAGTTLAYIGDSKWHPV
jgi:hypothetical protein